MEELKSAGKSSSKVDVEEDEDSDEADNIGPSYSNKNDEDDEEDEDDIIGPSIYISEQNLQDPNVILVDLYNCLGTISK